MTSAQRGVWALPGELINWGSSLIDPPEEAGDKKIKGARGMGTRGGEEGRPADGSPEAWAPAWGSPPFPHLASAGLSLAHWALRVTP